MQGRVNMDSLDEVLRDIFQHAIIFSLLEHDFFLFHSVPQPKTKISHPSDMHILLCCSLGK